MTQCQDNVVSKSQPIQLVLSICLSSCRSFFRFYSCLEKQPKLPHMTALCNSAQIHDNSETNSALLLRLEPSVVGVESGAVDIFSSLSELRRDDGRLSDGP